VLILPPGHHKEVTSRRRLGARERWLVSAVAAAVAALVIVTLVATASSGPKVGRGCVLVTVASSLGGQQIKGCGADARSICADVHQPGGYIGNVGTAVAAACRKQRIPVG
jgi:hypothetical protein